ncbi:MAG: ATP-binding protein [Dongiaceae bacterium]
MIIAERRSRLFRRWWWIISSFMLGRQAIILLTAASIACGIFTYITLTSVPPFGPNPNKVMALLTVNFILLLLLGTVVARQVVGIMAQRKQGRAGSRLHGRLVLVSSLLAVTPTIVVAIFSAWFFHMGVEAWFSERVTTALHESNAVAAAYLREHQENIRTDVIAIANDINREAAVLRYDPTLLKKMLETHAALRSLPEAIVFQKDGQVLASAGLVMALGFEQIPPNAFDQADDGEIGIVTSERDDRVRALIKVDNLPDAYLYIGRFVDPIVINHIQRTDEAVEAFTSLAGQREHLQMLFAAIYAVVALLLLLAAVGVGLLLANKLVTPISNLIDASGRVAAGDLTVQVANAGSADEFGTLARAFNRMTGQLESQRRELIEANRQIDNRRRFTEAVLSGVSAGIIGLDAKGLIHYPNSRAGELLGVDLDQHLLEPLENIVPDMAEVLNAATQRPQRISEKQIKLNIDGITRTLLVRVTVEAVGDEIKGYVVTFDDITHIVQVQRVAAWSDVARRLAHEIRNPLTPIQLAAERLNRKYLKQIQEDPETFKDCTDTIVRQVGDLNRMLEEFSAFARMPSPQMKEENPIALAHEATMLHRHAHQDIRFTLDLPDTADLIHCDARQIRQALTNLIKNSVEAIEARKALGDETDGHIILSLQQDAHATRLSVTDNGIGLPQEGRERLTEPYVTTRNKGTGLGLALVKRIMEDHGGNVVLEDADPNPQEKSIANISTGGAKVTLVFFTPQRDKVATAS